MSQESAKPPANSPLQAEIAAKLTPLDEQQNLPTRLEPLAKDVSALITRPPLEPKRSFWSFFPREPRPWEHTAHTFGFLPAATEGDQRQILGMGEVKADESLKNQYIKITLNTLRVAEYPGAGTHRILFEFYARHQVPGACEHLHFSAIYRGKSGQQVAIRGGPIFVGLGVGLEGVAFRFSTTNIVSSDDEAFLNVLDGDAFKEGLKLAKAAQPMIAPFANMMVALTKAAKERHRNQIVQECELGLDFSGTSMGARLAIGDYIAVQIPESDCSSWDWQEWVYIPRLGHIVSCTDRNALIPYNYVVFGVSRYHGDDSIMEIGESASRLSSRSRNYNPGAGQVAAPKRPRRST